MLHSKLPPAASLLLTPLVDSPTLADILLGVNQAGGARRRRGVLGKLGAPDVGGSDLGPEEDLA